MSTTLRRDWALAYASRGFVVLPLTQHGNQPHGMLAKGWHFCACTGGAGRFVGTTDADQIRRWWTDDPEANVGLVTGTRSRLLVLDVDVKRRDGHAVLAGWIRDRRAEGHVLPSHPTYVSPSGGRHHWFTLPPELDHVPRNDHWLPSVEVKSCGGLVAVPPSTRLRPFTQVDASDGSLIEWEDPVPYEWEPGAELPLAPDWLLADVAARREGAPANVSCGTDDENAALPDTATFLERGFGWFTGSRNRDCFRLACRLWMRYPSEASVTRVIRDCWSVTPGHDVDFPWHEVVYTVNSARSRMRRRTDAEDAFITAWRKRRGSVR